MTREFRPVRSVVRRGQAVRWGCTEHHTPAGQPCQWCPDQGELFTRAEAATATHRKC